MLEVRHAVLQQQIGQLAAQILEEHSLQHSQQHLGDALGQLENDVAGEPVADDHVHVAVRHITGLDVAHEADARNGLEQLMGFFEHRGTLALLCAVVGQRHAGGGAALHLVHIAAAHDSESGQHLGAALDIRAAVQQQEILLCAGHRGGQRRALDPLDGAHDQTGAHMQRAGGTSGNKGIRLAIFQHRQAFDQAGIRFVAHGLDRVIVHIHILGAVNQLKGGQVHAKLLGSGLDLGLITQQGQGHAITKLFYRIGCALYGRFRGVIATHCVQ